MKIYTKQQGVLVPEDTAAGDIFTTHYLQARSLEKRVYTDEQLRRLPQVDKKHPHYAEWAIRRRSANDLFDYLKRRRRPDQILEIGCGNGWLSHMLAGLPEGGVTGVDINLPELQQAARVFEEELAINLTFMYVDDYTQLPDYKKYDIIVFAASIQYFPDIHAILQIALDRLADFGEIHIIDTHFYKEGELAKARQSSEAYYRTLGVPDMMSYYHHHHIESFLRYNSHVLGLPATWYDRFMYKKRPFPWIRIRSSQTPVA